MCVARGREREGVYPAIMPRLWRLSNLGLKVFGEALTWSSARGATCGGAADRSAHSAVPNWMGEAKNEAKRGPGRLKERRMTQHEAPRAGPKAPEIIAPASA